MQTTLRIDDDIYRQAKAEAARRGVTMTRFIEESLQQSVAGLTTEDAKFEIEIAERDQLMEELRKRTAHFRMGPKPTRDEMNER